MHVAFAKMKSGLSETLVFFAIFRCVQMKIEYNTYPEEVHRVTPYEPKVVLKSCLLKPDSGPCRANMKMYHYDPAQMKCVSFYWGGCQGNGNKYNSEQECTETCLSRPNARSQQPRYCKLSFDYGFCFGAMKRWYYDHLWKVCKETIYSGCGGNKNNFYSVEQCESVCRFGLGPLDIPKDKKGGMKKVLIINPWNTTPARGKNQATNATKTQ